MGLGDFIFILMIFGIPVGVIIYVIYVIYDHVTLPKRRAKIYAESAEIFKRKQEEEWQKEQEVEKIFNEVYRDQTEFLFSGHPEVLRWWLKASTDPRDANLVAIERKYYKTKSQEVGRILLDDNGNVIKWDPIGGLYEEKGLLFPIEPASEATLEQNVRIEKIGAMLKDNDNIRKYCDLVSSQLLEDDMQAFNACEGLKCSAERFKAEYYDDSWISAWKVALTNEFNARNVEYKGDGIFMLTAV